MRSTGRCPVLFYNALSGLLTDYLICYTREHNIYFNTWHKQPFALDVWGVNTKNYIILKDAENKVIEDAKVSLLDGRICAYSFGMASYELPNIIMFLIISYVHCSQKNLSLLL